MSKSIVRHYMGTPIWGNKGEVLAASVRNGGAFVSYARPDQIKQCLDQADSVAIDNGAFSAWKRGLELDWTKFYQWLGNYYHHNTVKFFIIPDTITGTEEDNDKLVNSVPSMYRDKAVPCWHLHESIDRLIRLCKRFDRVAFGSSGEYATIRTKKWHGRMKEAFLAMDDHGVGDTKIHGLRMLDGRVLGNYPLTTADSTNLACNVPKYNVKYPHLGGHILSRVPLTKDDINELKVYRAASLRGAIESVNPPTMAEWIKVNGVSNG